MITRQEMILASLQELISQYESIRRDADAIIEGVRRIKIGLDDIKKYVPELLEEIRKDIPSASVDL